MVLPNTETRICSSLTSRQDLLSISDRETWAYGEALREMAVEKGFTCIEFARMKHLLDFPIPDEELREITYVANCTNFRRLLINTYGKDDLDIDQEIANNPDTRLTYLGYRRFLESDLKYIFPPTKDRTKNGYRRDVKFLAKQMLMRGYVNIAPFVPFIFQTGVLFLTNYPCTGFCGGNPGCIPQSLTTLNT